MADDTMFSYTLEIKDGDKSGLITARGNDEKEFIKNLATLDDIIEKRGLVAKPVKTFETQSYINDNQPSKNISYHKKEKEWTGDKCPQDGGRLYHIKTSTGKDMCKCENGKYDFKTKTASGCDFVAWGLNLADAKKRQEEWKAKKDKEDLESEY
jgi:hypothetical protein